MKRPGARVAKRLGYRCVSREVLLEDVSFWVNRGGDNWLAFSVGKARELEAEIPVTVTLNRKGANGSGCSDGIAVLA